MALLSSPTTGSLAYGVSADGSVIAGGVGRTGSHVGWADLYEDRFGDAATPTPRKCHLLPAGRKCNSSLPQNRNSSA